MLCSNLMPMHANNGYQGITTIKLSPSTKSAILLTNVPKNRRQSQMLWSLRQDKNN